MSDDSSWGCCERRGRAGGGGVRGQSTREALTATAADLTRHTRPVDTAGQGAPAGKQAWPLVCMTWLSELV